MFAAYAILGCKLLSQILCKVKTFEGACLSTMKYILMFKKGRAPVTIDSGGVAAHAVEEPRRYPRVILYIGDEPEEKNAGSVLWPPGNNE